MRKQKGFTLIEIVVVLAIIAAIAAFLTPMLFEYLKESKVSRAKVDVKNIAAAIANFNRDLQIYPVYVSGTDYANGTVSVLYTNEGNPASDEGTMGFNSVNSQTLDTALYNGLMQGANTYSSAVKKPGEWKGPYMSDFKADPWGNRYYVAVIGLQPGSNKAAFVISAGPDGILQTNMSQTVNSSSLFNTAGDDIVYRIK